MTYDAVVVGAGIMRCATAHWLARNGKRVLVVDRDEPGNASASSSDEARFIRYEYRGREIYTEMVARSVRLWKNFERETGREFYCEHGMLAMQTVSDHRPRRRRPNCAGKIAKLPANARSRTDERRRHEEQNLHIFDDAGRRLHHRRSARSLERLRRSRIFRPRIQIWNIDRANHERSRYSRTDRSRRQRISTRPETEDGLRALVGQTLSTGR